MGKKPIKTLQAVLRISKAFDGHFDQSLIEQVLKDCGGDVETCICFLSSMHADSKPLLEVESRVSDSEITSSLHKLHEQLQGIDFDEITAVEVLFEESFNIENSVARIYEIVFDESRLDNSATVPRLISQKSATNETSGAINTDFSPTVPGIDNMDELYEDPKKIFMGMFVGLLNIVEAERTWIEAVGTTASTAGANELINRAISAAISQVENMEDLETSILNSELKADTDLSIVPILSEDDQRSMMDMSLATMVGHQNENASAQDVAIAIVKEVLTDGGHRALADCTIMKALQRCKWDPEAAINLLSSSSPNELKEDVKLISSMANPEGNCTLLHRRSHSVQTYAGLVKNGSASPTDVITSTSTSTSSTRSADMETSVNLKVNSMKPMTSRRELAASSLISVSRTAKSSSMPTKKSSCAPVSQPLSPSPSTSPLVLPPLPPNSAALDSTGDDEGWRTVSWRRSYSLPNSGRPARSSSSWRREEVHWRGAARNEGLQMREIYREAAALHAKNQGALAGHVSSRGQLAKDRMLRYDAMAAKCAIMARNPHILVEVIPSGQLAFNGCSADNPNDDNNADKTSPSSRSGKLSGRDGSCNKSSNSSRNKREAVTGGDSEPIRIALDLHGLYVKEAVGFVSSMLDHYHALFDTPNVQARLVVGKGIHSAGGLSRLGPALKKFLDAEGVVNSSSEGELLLQI